MREEALEWPESKNKDPELPDDYEQRCINCGNDDLVYDGPAGTSITPTTSTLVAGSG